MTPVPTVPAETGDVAQVREARERYLSAVEACAVAPALSRSHDLSLRHTERAAAAALVAALDKALARETERADAAGRRERNTLSGAAEFAVRIVRLTVENDALRAENDQMRAAAEEAFQFWQGALARSFSRISQPKDTDHAA